MGQCGHDITLHGNIEALGKETVELFRNLPFRHGPSDGPGLEAACVLVVEHDNLRKNEALPPNASAPVESILVEGTPAPQAGDPLHYGAMIRRVCRAFQERWGP